MDIMMNVMKKILLCAGLLIIPVVHARVQPVQEDTWLSRMQACGKKYYVELSVVAAAVTAGIVWYCLSRSGNAKIEQVPDTRSFHLGNNGHPRDGRRSKDAYSGFASGSGSVVSLAQAAGDELLDEAADFDWRPASQTSFAASSETDPAITPQQAIAGSGLKDLFAPTENQNH
jgi:hypothetical protein